jgi:hypothetical protein
VPGAGMKVAEMDKATKEHLVHSRTSHQ